MACESQTRLLARCNVICSWFLCTRNYVRVSTFLSDDILGSMMLGIRGQFHLHECFFFGGGVCDCNFSMCFKCVLGSLSMCFTCVLGSLSMISFGVNVVMVENLEIMLNDVVS
jgi:hypothetical protein